MTKPWTIEYDRYEVTLNDGTVVLGKWTNECGITAKTYANWTQAQKAAANEPD